MTTLPGWMQRERRHWSTALIVGLVLLFGFASSDLSAALSLTREGLAEGAWWRLFTSQVVHLSLAHTLLNAASFFLVSVAFRPEVTPLREILVIFLAMFGVGLGIAFLNPEIDRYVGLSGAVHGVLAHHLLLSARRSPKLAGVGLAALAAKLVHEQWFAAPDRAIEQLIGGPVAVDAHLYGVLVGLAAGFWAVAAGRRSAVKVAESIPGVTPERPDRHRQRG